MAGIIIKQFADPTVLIPALIALVIGIILVSTTWRYGGFVAMIIAAVGTYASYRLMRHMACSGMLGKRIAIQCTIGKNKRAAARTAVAVLPGVSSKLARLAKRSIVGEGAPIAAPPVELPGPPEPTAAVQSSQLGAIN
jgi:hypothetical protein